MQQTTNSDLSRHYLPRQLRHLILQEYLSGVKTVSYTHLDVYKRQV